MDFKNKLLIILIILSSLSIKCSDSGNDQIIVAQVKEENSTDGKRFVNIKECQAVDYLLNFGQPTIVEGKTFHHRFSNPILEEFRQKLKVNNQEIGEVLKEELKKISVQNLTDLSEKYAVVFDKTIPQMSKDTGITDPIKFSDKSVGGYIGRASAGNELPARRFLIRFKNFLEKQFELYQKSKDFKKSKQEQDDIKKDFNTQFNYLKSIADNNQALEFEPSFNKLCINSGYHLFEYSK